MAPEQRRVPQQPESAREATGSQGVPAACAGRAAADSRLSRTMKQERGAQNCCSVRVASKRSAACTAVATELRTATASAPESDMLATRLKSAGQRRVRRASKGREPGETRRQPNNAQTPSAPSTVDCARRGVTDRRAHEEGPAEARLGAPSAPARALCPVRRCAGRQASAAVN